MLEKLEMVHIPYKGDAPLSNDIVAGRVQIAIGTPGTAIQHAKEGKLRALATLLRKRNPLLPDAPTLAEAGLQDIPITPWGGLFGPAKMPKDVVDKIARATATVLARRDVLDGLDRLAFEGRSSTPEELGAFLKEQVEIWRRTVKEVGIAPD